MIVGGGLLTFGRTLLDLNPQGYADQLMLLSPGKLVVFYALSQAIVRNKEKFHRVQTLPFHNNIIECAKARNDDWGEAVLTRLGTSNDLVAEEVVYHSSCMAALKLNKVGRSARGRPEDPSWLMCSNTFLNGSKIRQKVKYILLESYRTR